jgi:cytochrome P450
VASALLPYTSIPEPPRVGLGGHLPEWLGIDNAKGVLARLHRYADTCGPVARVTLGPVRMILVSDATIAGELLEDPRANFKGASYILTRAVLDNVLLLNGEAWSTHRRAYRLALRDVDVGRAAHDVTGAFVARESQRARASSDIRLDRVVNELVGNVVAGFVASATLPDTFEQHRAVIQYELAGLGIDLQCQPWAYLDPSRWVRLRRAVAAARAFFRGVVERRLAASSPEPSDVVAGFRSLQGQGEYPAGIDALVDGAVNFFFTAHDVLSSSTMFCLHLLAQHPAEASTVRRELERLPVGPLDKAAFEELPALDRAVRESLRLFPGYALFGRTLQEDMPVGGYEVERGTLAIVSPFVTHRLERYWPDAGRFAPERWQGRGPTTLSPTAHADYMPFGSGARGCLASHLAVPILKTIVARWLRAFDLGTVASHTPRIAYWGSAYSENGLRVRLTPRGGSPRDETRAPR